MPSIDDIQDQDQQLTGDDLSELHGIALQLQAAGDPRAEKLWDFIADQSGGGDGRSVGSVRMISPTTSGNAEPSPDSDMRPETAEFLHDLSGIGTGAYLAMRQPDPPEYEDWRDQNFAADGSGSYVSQEGQTYSDDKLGMMHGLLSRQAGNPLVSQLFDGPKSPLADYMTWRNQNFDNETGAGWEDEDGNLYSEPALQEMFATKPETKPAQAQSQGTNQRPPFALPETNNVEEFFGGRPRFQPGAGPSSTGGTEMGLPPGFQAPLTSDTEQFFGGRPKFSPGSTQTTPGPDTPTPVLDLDRRHAPPFLPSLSAPVGPGQPNRPDDVRLVQRLYNQMLAEGRMATVNKDHAAPELIESGVYDAATADALRAVQKLNFHGMPNPFGVVTPDGTLFKSLAETVTGPNSATNWISPEMQEAVRVMLPNAAQGNVDKYLPSVLKALRGRGMANPAMLEYALATINAETPTFRPISEQVDSSNTTQGGQPFDRYEGRTDLCNTEPGDGARFKGRGFVQLTGRCNYEDMTNWLQSRNIHVDLVQNPDLANDPKYAPMILAHYLEEKNGASDIQSAIDGNQWVTARAAVNGWNGHTGRPNGLYEFGMSREFLARQGQIKARASQDPNFSLADAAGIWTEGASPQQERSFLDQTAARLGVDQDTKLADLNPQQRASLMASQIRYERNAFDGDRNLTQTLRSWYLQQHAQEIQDQYQRYLQRRRRNRNQ